MSVAENRMALVFLLRGAGVSEKAVLEAMEVIPRDRFVDGVFKARAYEDTPLPIPCGQTISAPSIVGRMTQALNLTKSHKVLEIGTGSGYQAAILGKLARRVYTVERHSELAKIAEARLRELQLSNVTVMKSDGGFGLANQAPFDRIMVTAAVDDPPKSLLAQLKIGGIMVVPVGRSDAVQQLIRIVKLDTGNEYEELGSVRFVPLVEGHA